MAKIKRACASAMAVIMLIAVILSSCFVIAEAEHRCTAENCQICRVIQDCLNSLKNSGNIGGEIKLIAVAFIFLSAVLLTFTEKNNLSTLVSLKVKLSD